MIFRFSMVRTIAWSSDRAESSSGTPSLTLRTNPAQGMHVHIGRVKRDDAKIKTNPSFIAISENASTSSYFYQVCSSYSPAQSHFTNVSQPWSQLGGQIVQTTAAIANAEKEIFNSLRDEVCFGCIRVRYALRCFIGESIFLPTPAQRPNHRRT